MFCRYCGKPIAEDSIYCQHCGSYIGVVGCNNNARTKPFTDKIGFYISKIRNSFKWSDIVSSLKNAAIFIWKVIHSSFVILGMIIIYTIIGFIMAPFIAMFNVEFPSLGMSDILVDIWKKKKAEDIPEEESQPN